MYKWKIVIYLNTGLTLSGVYNGSECNSGDVSEKLFATDSTYTGILNEYETGQLVVKNDAIVAFTIVPLKIDNYRIEEDRGTVKLNLKEKLEGV